MICSSPLYGDFVKNANGYRSHVRLQPQEVVADYHRGLLSVRGLLLLFVKAVRRPTKRFRILNVSRFCSAIGIGRSSFYKALNALQESGDIGVQDEPDQMFLWWIDKESCSILEEEDKEYLSQAIQDDDTADAVDLDAVNLNKDSLCTDADAVSPNRENQSLEPSLDKGLKDLPDINTTKNTTEDLNKKSGDENLKNSSPPTEVKVEIPKPKIEDPYFNRGNWHKKLQQEFKQSAPASEERALKEWELSPGYPEQAFVKFVLDLGIRVFKWNEDCEGLAISYINNPKNSIQMEAHYRNFLRKMSQAGDTALQCLQNGMIPVLPPELTEQDEREISKEEVLEKIFLVRQQMPAGKELELPSSPPNQQISAVEIETSQEEKTSTSSDTDWVEKVKTDWIPLFSKNARSAEMIVSAIVNRAIPPNEIIPVLQLLFQNESSRRFALTKANELGIELQ